MKTYYHSVEDKVLKEYKWINSAHVINVLCSQTPNENNGKYYTCWQMTNGDQECVWFDTADEAADEMMEFVDTVNADDWQP